MLINVNPDKCDLMTLNAEAAVSTAAGAENTSNNYQYRPITQTQFNVSNRSDGTTSSVSFL